MLLKVLFNNVIINFLIRINYNGKITHNAFSLFKRQNMFQGILKIIPKIDVFTVVVNKDLKM